MDTEAGKDEHDDYHQDCDQEDLFEPSEELEDDSSDMGHEGVDAERSHGSEDHQQLGDGVDFNRLRQPGKEDHGCLERDENSEKKRTK